MRSFSSARTKHVMAAPLGSWRAADSLAHGRTPLSRRSMEQPTPP